MTTLLFPFSEYWWFYAAFAGFIAVLLVVDVRAHRKPGPISARSAARWTALWIFLGLSFSAVIYLLASSRYGSSVARGVTFEYLAGYLVEESLSVDNMFVFALLFRYFSLKPEQQHRVLFYGIVGAMVFRGIFVAAGAALIRFHFVVVGFGVFLVVSGLRMAFAGEKTVEPESSFVVRFVRKFVPVTPDLRGLNFVVREAGALAFTPLMVILLVVETTDIAFAIDSVPAVFAVTREPLIVYTSNVFAILGLRALYFVLSEALGVFQFLKFGLAFVLVFIGLKMVVLDDLAGGRLPIGISLGVIVTAVGTSLILSLVFRTSSPARTSQLSQFLGKAVGLAFAALSFASLIMAAGLRPPGFEALKVEWLLVSSLGHATCSWVLLRHHHR